MSRILVTGGAGYIGSHACVELIEAGHDVIVLDNLSNSHAESLEGVERITGVRPSLFEVDLRDRDSTVLAVREAAPEAVIHFAGLKYVGESMRQPVRYFQHNVAGTINLLRALQSTNARALVFSSSCTVYGQPESLPIRENAPTGNTASPYGQTKYLVERILIELQEREPAWNISILRYFNPLGAHPSGEIGEYPKGTPENLMPHLMDVALGRRNAVKIWGNDYPTRDGTGVRDYVHVCDLARGHLAALERLGSQPGIMVHNLGTGNGYTVLEVLEAFEKASGREIPRVFEPRRPGDLAEIWSDCARAERELDWRATRTIEAMCEDTWRWLKVKRPAFGQISA